MSIQGWYYLHINGDLIYKRDLDGTAADIRESSFARGMWPLDPTDRITAWQTLVEASAAGARKERIDELSAKWGCDDADAQEFGKRIGCDLQKDGASWFARHKDFMSLREFHTGMGNTCLEAMAALAKAMGYRPSKMWGPTFITLLNDQISPPRTAA